MSAALHFVALPTNIILFWHIILCNLPTNCATQTENPDLSMPYYCAHRVTN